VSDAAAGLSCGRAASSRGGDFRGGPLVGGLIKGRRAPKAKLRDETPSSAAIVALERARAWITAVIHERVVARRPRDAYLLPSAP
jgi:hypothetical protein